MQPDWRETKLGELLTLEYGKALTENSRDGIGYPVYGSSGKVGQHSTALVGHAPWIVVGRKGTAGSVIWSEEPGWPIDTTYYVRLREGAAVTLEFMYLLLQAADLPGICAQTGVPGLNRDRVYEMRVKVPPRREQLRIVDLVSSIDKAIQRAESESTSLMSAREALSAEFFDSRERNSTRIDELLEISIGGVWGDGPGESETDVRVYRSTEFTNEGWLEAEGGVTRSITERQLRSRRLQGGDILLEKSGGGPNQPVGRVVWVPDLEHDSVCANFVQLIRPDTSKVDALYLWHLLWWWHRSGKTEQFQRRTTGIRNLQTKDYLGETISLPERDDQQRVIDILNDVEEARLSALIVRERLSILRSDALSELLSGGHRIPDSYDRLLEDAS